MTERKKEFRVNKKQAQRLLELTLHNNEDNARISSDARKERLLLDALRSRLPLERALPSLIQSIAGELESLSGAPVGSLLADPDTDADTLSKIKDCAKTQGNAAPNEIEREVAKALYYAAIASAMVYHDVKISEHSRESLKGAFGELVKRAWVPANLLSIFQAALAHSSLEGETPADT